MYWRYTITLLVYNFFSCLDSKNLTVCSEKGTAPTISHMSLEETELKRWLNTARMPSPRLWKSESDKHRYLAHRKAPMARKLPQG